MTSLEVDVVDAGDPLRFKVRIGDGERETHHYVSMSRTQFDALAGGSATPEQCVRAAFRFLLDREPGESILTRFDVAIIGSYFPDFQHEFARYLAAR
jgi:hypothetical protein